MTTAPSLPPSGVVRHVVLDRDGVLNREGDAPISAASAWLWERGALEGLATLADRRVAVSVATNQSAIGRGTIALADVEAIHAWLASELRRMGIDLVGIRFCPHIADAGCRCRKPAPGLVLDAIAASGVDPSETVMIGDDRRDLEAGLAAGTSVVLVRTGKGGSVDAPIGTTVAAHLADAVAGLPLAPRQRSLR